MYQPAFEFEGIVDQLFGRKSLSFIVGDYLIGQICAQMSSGQDMSGLNQADLLYLVFRYLQTVPGFDQTGAALRTDMVNSSALGKTIGWDGAERTVDIDDVTRNYPNIFPQQLGHLLHKSMVNMSSSPNVLPSLLRQILGVMNPLNSAHVKRYTELSAKLSDILSKLRAVNHQSKVATYRISFLDRMLLARGEDGSGETDMLDDMAGDDDVVPILQEVGRSKELVHLKAQVSNADDSRSLLNVEIDTLTNEMAQLGCLSSGLHRGHVDSALCWLQSRELGITSMGTGSGSALGRALVPSATSMRNKLLSHYRLLWTVSGHMMNPAYCCVFDRTGRYLLTGADDYLVKIWNVAKGQLIRTCKGHMGYISLIAVSPDNSLFASACTMGTIRIWRLRDGLCLQVFKHKASVNWIKFDDTSCALASASDDGQCIVWDLSKLLPEDGADVPLLDVIMEQRAANQLTGAGTSGAKFSRELDQLNDDFYETSGAQKNVTETIDMEKTGAAAASSCSNAAASSISAIASHTGEARLVSALTNTAIQAARASVPFVGPDTTWGAPAVGDTALHAPIQLYNSRGGLFRWSGGAGADPMDEAEAMLVLHHMQDVMATSSGGDPLKVQCLDISAMGNILVTGCEDGVARVWRIGDPEQMGAYSTRNPKLPLEGILQKLRHMVSPSEYNRMKRVAGHLLMRLEGHVSGITDIHLNHLGDRVLTGSAQDCNVRIWSLSRDMLRSEQVVLDLTEEEEAPEGEASAQSRSRGGRNGRSRLKSQLYNACWTADSTKIVTIQSVLLRSTNPTSTSTGSAADQLPTRLKVWDAINGDLLKVVWKISDICCRTLSKHPLNPSVVMTCGEDGYVNVWDIDQEERLSSVRLYNDDKTPCNIVDASFSHDGTLIAVTDFVGRLSVLGLDDPARYESVLKEQYFSTDYLDIALDNVGFAIDVGTQMPVHEAPIGPMIRLDGTPYDIQPVALQGPPVASKDDIRAMLKEISQDRKRSLKEMDRVFNTFSRNKARGRLPRKYRGSKPKSIRALEELNRQQSGAPERVSRVTYKEFDFNTYNPSTDESEDSDFDIHDGEEPDISRRHRFPREAREARPQGHRSARIATLQSSSSQRRSSRSRTHIGSYNDEDEEDNAYTGGNGASVASRAARASLREARRARQQYNEYDSDSNVEETDDSLGSENIHYTSEEGEEGEGRTRSQRSRENGNSRPRRSKASKRSKAPRISADDEMDEEEQPVAPRPKKVKAPVFYKAKHGTVLCEGVEASRKWLQTDAPTPQYSPQLGDKVMYFPQGHIQWLQEFPESSSPPWMAFPQKWPIVECEVREIQYMFPDTPQEHKLCCSAKAKVLLAVVRIPSKHVITSHNQYILDLVEPRATRHSTAKEITFTVILRDWDLPDFLVPSDLFMRSVRLAWHTGVRVSVQFKNYSEEEKSYVFNTYMGQVAGISNASAEWPQSPWDCIDVAWDVVEGGNSDDFSRVGPWEAIPQYDASSEYSRILSQFPLAKLDEAEAARIVQEIDTLMTSEQYAELFSPFEFEVDASAFPTYYRSIVVPICVELIKNRLTNGFYRQIEAVEFDVGLMYQNCCNFNDEDSDIVLAAQHLKAELLKIINPSGGAPAGHKAVADSAHDAVVAADENLTLRIRSGGRSRGQSTQEYTLVNLGGSARQSTGRSTRLRGDSQTETANEAKSDSVLRIKRHRDEANGADHSPIKAQRSRQHSAPATTTSRRESREEPVGHTTRRGRGTGRGAEERSDMEVSPSNRRTRSRAAVNYQEPDEDDPEEEESAQDSEDQDGDSQDGHRRRSSRNSRTAQLAPRSSKVKDSDRKSSKSSRRHGKDNKTSAWDVRRRSRAQRSESSAEEDSESSKDSDDESSAQESSVVSDQVEEEEEVTTRSKRVVKAPPNFAAEMAQAQAREPAQAQLAHRNSRRQAERIAHVATSVSRATATTNAVAGRVNPSQRYQDEQRRLHQEREQREHEAQLQQQQQARNRRIDPDVKRQMLQVVSFAEEIDQEALFAEPVTEDIAPGYFEIIMKPVDLSTIRSNINTRHYDSVSEVVADVLQMYENCELYNEDASAVGREASRQRSEFKRFCKKNHLPQ